MAISKAQQAAERARDGGASGAAAFNAFLAANPTHNAWSADDARWDTVNPDVTLAKADTGGVLGQVQAWWDASDTNKLIAGGAALLLLLALSGGGGGYRRRGGLF